MLASSSTSNLSGSAAIGVDPAFTANIPNWNVLETALDRLLPVNPSTSNAAFASEELLKLYTIVFDYCVGNGAASEKKLSGKFLFEIY